MKLLFSFLKLVCLVSAFATVQCSVDRLAGGGTIETTNGRVKGGIAYSNGDPAPHTLVALIPAEYDPIKDTVKPTLDTTDDGGHYIFSNVTTGSYNIMSTNFLNKTKAFTTDIKINHDTVTVASIRLLEPGTIKVQLPDSNDLQHGYMYIPGTTIMAMTNSTSGFAVLDSVPVGCMSSVAYATTNSTLPSVIRYNVEVESRDTVFIFNPAWSHSRVVLLNTSTSGAAIAGNVYGFPILIRLTASNFDFSQAQTNGQDVRFAKPDNVKLPYEIEQWDAVKQQAEIWVKTDTILGNNSTQPITMYWGNPAAPNASSGTSTFDTTNGFQGVWHLGEPGNTTVHDATLNGYNGTPYNMSAASQVPGAIGNCQEFSGDSGYIDMPGTAAGKLDFPKDGSYTVSAWACIDTIDGKNHIIASKGDNQYSLIKYSYNDSWYFAEFKDLQGWDAVLSPFAAVAEKWTNVVGVRKGMLEYLYVDGVCVDSGITMLNRSVENRYTGFDFMIGRVKSYLEASRAFYFKGKIDEVQACNVVRNADWIALCYMNQRTDDKLVIMK